MFGFCFGAGGEAWPGGGAHELLISICSEVNLNSLPGQNSFFLHKLLPELEVITAVVAAVPDHSNHEPAVLQQPDRRNFIIRLHPRQNLNKYYKYILENDKCEFFLNLTAILNCLKTAAKKVNTLIIGMSLTSTSAPKWTSAYQLMSRLTLGLRWSRRYGRTKLSTGVSARTTACPPLSG